MTSQALGREKVATLRLPERPYGAMLVPLCFPPQETQSPPLIHGGPKNAVEDAISTYFASVVSSSVTDGTTQIFTSPSTVAPMWILTV
jgi:hypothetical protein